jgi:hypothetical protein
MPEKCDRTSRESPKIDNFHHLKASLQTDELTVFSEFILIVFAFVGIQKW